MFAPVVSCFVEPLQWKALLGGGFGFGTVNGFVQLRDAAHDLLSFSGITTQQVVIEVNLVLT